MNKSILNQFNFNSLTSALYLGLFLSAISFCWFSSIKKLSVSVASSFLPFTAVVSLLGSVFFLKETISIQQFAGSFFIIGGMIWQANLHVRKA